MGDGFACVLLCCVTEPNSNLDMLGRDISNASILPKLEEH